MPQMVKNLPATQETQVQSLGWEDPLKKGKTTQYSGLENSLDSIYSPWGCKKSDVTFSFTLGFPYSSVGKESACNAGHPGLTPGSGRSPGEGNGNPLQCSCLENLMDRGAWQATVNGVTRVGHDLATKLPTTCMKCSLGSLYWRDLIFPILLFFSVSFHWSLRKAFLSLLAILWHSASNGYICIFLLCLLFLFFS